MPFKYYINCNALYYLSLHVNLWMDSLPWALHALVMLPLIQGWNVGSEAITVCIVDGVFRLFLEGWYAITPFIVIFGDPVLRKDLPGGDYVLLLFNGVKSLFSRMCRRCGCYRF